MYVHTCTYMCVLSWVNFVLRFMLQGSSLEMNNGAEEYHRLRQSLSMLGFGTDVQMG